MSVKMDWKTMVERAYRAKRGIQKAVCWPFNRGLMFLGLGRGRVQGVRIPGSRLMRGVLVGLMVIMAPVALHAQVSLPYVTPTEFYEGETVTFKITISAEDAMLWNSAGSGYRGFLGGSGTATVGSDVGAGADYINRSAGTFSQQSAVQEGDNYTLSLSLQSYVDNVTENDETISFSIEGGYTGNFVYNNFGSMTITLKDGPRPTSGDGVTVSPTSLALTELGASSSIEKTYTVVLDTDPGADVTITLSNIDITAVDVDTDAGTTGNQNTLIFTHGNSGNWSTAQTVTVRALNDADGAGESFNITHAATAASGPYNGIIIDPVAVTVTDAGHGVVVSESSVSVAENDDTATYTVVLKSRPSGDVVISATSGATATAEVDTDSGTGGNQSTLTFTNANWDEPQTVTITGKGAGSTAISHAVQSSADTTNYPIARTIPSVSVSVSLTATPSVTVSPTSLALTELGASSSIEKTYTVVLDTDPGADVTITLSNIDITAVDVDTDAGTTGNQNTLIFTHGNSGNWSTAQTVTVRALNDADGAGESFNITHAATAASGPYNGIIIDPVAVTVTDAGHGVVVSESSVSVAENDDTATYTVVLKSRPSGDVVISATSGATATAEVDTDSGTGGNQSTLTFTNANWDEPQTVTITGKGAGSTAISHAVQSSADTTNYPTARTIPSVSVSVSLTVLPEIIITGTDDGEISVREGHSDTYTLVLTSTPQTNVVISITSRDPSIAEVVPKRLTFTPQNARTPQTVTVRGVMDNLANSSPRETVIDHAVATTDQDYRDVDIDPMKVTVEDKEGLAVAVQATDAGLTRFGRTVGQQVVDAVRDRERADRTRGFVSRLAGETLPRIAGTRDASERVEPGAWSDHDRDQVEGFGRENDADVTRALSEEDVLRGTSFTLNALKEDGTSLAFWGRGSISEFRGTAEGLFLEGDVRDVMMGADRLKDARLMGIMVMGSRGDITYRFGDDTGRLETALTSFVPYGRRDFRNGMSFWGAVGVGWGTLTLTPEGREPLAGPLDWHMAAGGIEGRLSGVDLLPEADLGWHTDALWTRTRSEPTAALPALGGTTTRVRLGVDATWPETPALKGLVSPHAGVGLRYDGGDAETGFGLEIEGGVTWRDPESHLSLSVEGRTLAVHEERAFRDWGMTFGLVWDPRPDTKEGFSATFGYDLGHGTSGEDALLGPETYPGQNEAEGETSWHSEVAYGVSRGGGLVGSSYGGVSGTSDDVEEARVGYRIEPDTPHAENMSIDVWTDPVAEKEEKSAGAGLTWWW